MAKACNASRRRLGVDQIDLYLLHWRGGVPLAQTIDGFQALQARGWIRRWGVSNFALHDMQELFSLPGGTACATNQVYYSIGERGIEFDLLPWMRERRIPVMAYCPIDGGALARHAGLASVAQRRAVTPTQLALAWLLAQRDVIAIPKAVRESHLRENLASAAVDLGAAEHAELDALFPAPDGPRPLAMV
jgi:diketogulonate reductase-like aldo/keto reductase